MIKVLLSLLWTIGQVEGREWTQESWDREMANPAYAMDKETQDDLRVGTCIRWAQDIEGPLPDICRQ